MCSPRKGRSRNCGAKCSATRCSKFCGACRASRQRTVMQISADQLLGHLKRGPAPIYFVYGEEQLLVEECTRAIRDAAHATGYHERQVLTVESGFDWNGLFNSTQSLSLFSERRLIELRLPTGKPGEAGSKILDRKSV